jgi:hypothetical protein
VRRQASGADRSAVAESTPAPAPRSYRTGQFWLGALAAACLLVPVAIAAALLSGGGDDKPASSAHAAVAPSATSADQESEAERIRRWTETRDKKQVKELTDRMRDVSEDLAPVVAGLANTLPLQAKHKIGPLADRSEVEGWIRKTRLARDIFKESESGETGTNVARGAFAASLRSLAEATANYKLALDEPSARTALLESVRAQWDLAVKAWSTAAVQLDAINIAVGFGHQHVTTLGAGGTPPDDLPEGTGATEPLD